MTEVNNPDEIQKVMTLCARLKPPRPRGQPAQWISRDDFHKLLAVADTRWKAVFLLSLNAGFHPQDVFAVLRTSLDISKRLFMGPRGKTGVLRIAVLWDRTVEAINAYLEACPGQNELLFPSPQGSLYDKSHIAACFRKIRRTAGLPDTVKFCHIRDGAASSAFHEGARHGMDTAYIDVLLGHKIQGEKGKYISLHPYAVEPICQAIEEYYFGTRSTQISKGHSP